MTVLFGREDELQVHSHAVGQTLQQLQGRVARAVFQLADVGLIDAGALGKLLLGQVLRNACVGHGADDIHFRLIFFPFLTESIVLQLFVQVHIQCFHLIHQTFP